jgi:hypothetical protein
MIIVAHRGNRFGRNPDLENHPDYLIEAINAGFHVEVDVWCDRKTDTLWLGHDDPRYKVSVDFLKHRFMWCHAKNIEALESMISNHIHCFWHDSDKYTITSRGYFWCYPNNYSAKGITVDLNDGVTSINHSVLGICTDIAEKWRTEYEL